MSNGFKRRRRILLGSAVAVAFAAPVPAIAQAQTFQFNIPAQPLDASLRALARTSRQQILFDRSLVRGRTAPALVGSFSVDDGLSRLLADSGLRAIRGRRGAYVVTVGPGEAEAGSAAADNGSADSDIVVTGTSIRGVYPASSPVDIYNARDIERTGATTTEQFIQRLPQNFATRSQYAPFAIGSGDRLNPNAVAGVDLRGLGLGTTLTLLNGRRMGLADFGRTADIAMIPASAIDRIEVLTDGASAIYGSDAIGGVVNFVLRRDFNGAETRISVGGVTSGSLQQGEISQTFGRSWGSGHGLVSFSAFSASALDLADRGYTAAAHRGTNLGTLTPSDQRQNLLATLSQNLSDRLTVSADLILSWRDIETETPNVSSSNSASWTLLTSRSETAQTFANAALDYAISPRLHGALRATYAETNVHQDGRNVRFNLTPPTFTFSSQEKHYGSIDLTAQLDGSLPLLPGGDLRFALGAGVIVEEFSGTNPTLLALRGELGRLTSYAYGELLVPIIGEEQNVPLVHRLELSLAGRYTRYDDRSDPALNQEFGDAVDPKVGLLWAPFEALSFRATYGTSFRAPSLIQLDETSSIIQVDQAALPIPFPSGPSPSTIITLGERPVEGLRPETATTYTIGFDFRPRWRPTLRISGTYYNISYQDRIARAVRNGLAFIQTPDLYASAIYRAPSAAFIEEAIRSSNNLFSFVPGIDLTSPAAAAQALFTSPNPWIFDSRTRNLAISDQEGFDISVNDRIRTDWGEVRYGATITHILSYRQQNDPNSPIVSVINNATQPVDLRGRAYVGLSRGRFDGTLNVNYIDDYTNSLSALGGASRIDSWTTVDLNLSYDFGETASGLTHGLRLSLSVQNLFDEDPPFVSGGAADAVFTPVGFDPANANPLGRFILFGLTKRW